MYYFYCEYPGRGTSNLGAAEGSFENIVMYCDMAYYDKRPSVGPLKLHEGTDSLFVWSRETINELNKKGGSYR